ncbi:MAG TPA: AmmeMemoRadiSam system radical SAM enzyme [Planctomycetota bacterium]|nr:AmmeMemoRadiSam system radical SAM enzyme [Planctomycetota bacterium]
MKEAAYYDKRGEARVQCHLCPHNCVIAEGRVGLCGVRRNRAGTLYSEIYEQVTSVAMDPIEKKPLYHFHPGSSILSLGTRGCNFACEFCQNWGISQADAATSPLKSAAAVQAARREGSIGIAYTYNEPLIWFEYVLETAKLAREAGLVNVLVSNGYASPEPFEELLPYVDAMNLDIKAIRPEFYKRLCRGTLEPVLANARAASRRTHLEVTNLVVPGHNDTDEEFDELGRWVAGELGAHVPMHLSAYFPRHKLKAPPTPVETLQRAHAIVSKHLRYVYLGNCYSDAGSSTRCHQCGATLITRRGYQVRVVGLTGALCASCGAENSIVVA